MSHKNNPQPQAEERSKSKTNENKKSNLRGHEFHDPKNSHSKPGRSKSI